jgi:hypothetical protein
VVLICPARNALRQKEAYGTSAERSSEDFGASIEPVGERGS